MKHPLLLLFAGMCMSIGAMGQQIQKIKAYTYADSTLIESLLEEKNIPYEIVSSEKYRIKLNRFDVLLSIDDGDMLLRTYFTDQPSLTSINAFNMQHRWARVYIDTDGGLTLAQELSFKGGISRETIHTCIDTYGVILIVLSKLIE